MKSSPFTKVLTIFLSVSTILYTFFVTFFKSIMPQQHTFFPTKFHKQVLYSPHKKCG